jgi:hypothetical protein
LRGVKEYTLEDNEIIMIYKAYELLPKLKHLTLSGQNKDGDLEFIGTTEEWQRAEADEIVAFTKLCADQVDLKDSDEYDRNTCHNV